MNGAKGFCGYYKYCFFVSDHAKDKQKINKRNFKKILSYFLIVLFLLCLITYRLKITGEFLLNKRQEIKTLEGTKTKSFSSTAKFQNDWCIVESARRDWKQLLRACINNTLWRESIPSHKAQATDPDKSFIDVWDVKPAGQFSRLRIRSQTKKGEPKFSGGDAWRVHLRGPSFIAPTVIDQNNGSYDVIFVAMVSGKYMVEIMLDYSLCDGLRDPPQDWFIKGNAQGKNQPQGILGRDSPYILKPLWGGTPIEIVILPPLNIEASIAKNSIASSDIHYFRRSCSIRCNYLWSGFGAWINDSWKPNFEEKIGKRWPHHRQGLLWFYGDSAAKKLHNSLKNTALCKTLFRRCDYSYSWVYQIENYNLTLQQYVKNDLTIAKAQTDDLDFNISPVLNEISQVLFHPEMDDKSVIILNCGLHFVENTNFSNYQRLIDRIIDLLNKSETGEGKGKGKIFRGKLIWKSTTAINRQKYTGNHLHSRRFLTYQRILLYNAYAMDAMCKAGVDVLDVYPLTDSYPGGTGSTRFPYDPVHYADSVFSPVQKLLERYFS